MQFLEDLSVVKGGDLPREHLLRITLFASTPDSESVARRVEEAIAQPVYMTHFPLSALPQHRESPLQVVDVQPPCRGKAEGLRVLEERFGIPADRVVAVGDADNDLPMLRLAGVAVAMANATAPVREAAHRVIGDNNGDAIPRLLDELFG